MDYEKKYKEALGKARQLCAYPTSKPFISDLQDIFPELKESEDEKIKQELIEYHKAQAFLDGKNNNKHVKFVAWLEKQGEQKPAEWSEEDEENFARVDYACLKTYGGDSYSSDWLRKFLGIHKKWKPSDEQMKLLREVQQALLGKDCHNRFVDFMYELKRLREE